jgi:diacylglycerol O-acyltransferase / wax synthase
VTEANIPSRRPMEPFDTLMYRSESDPYARSTLLGLFILDRSPDWDRLVEAFERITRLVLPLRQRVVEPTFPVTMPVWAVDPDFDLSYHLRRTRVPEPGTQARLLELLEPITMSPLDRARPLWEFTLIEGLEDGSAAWITKVNHAIADGIGGQELAQLSFDLERDPPPHEMPPAPEADEISPNALVRQALAMAPTMAVLAAARGGQTAARVAERLVRRPGRTLTEAVAYTRSLAGIMSGPSVEPSPLMRARGLRRRLLVLEVPLDHLKAASKAAGGSVNDGFLSAVCGGLRRYHEQLGSPVASVPMAIPISLRKEGDPAGGNRWTGARLAPPVDEPDPAERIRHIRDLMLQARQEPALDALNLLAPVAVWLPNWLLSSAFGGAAVPDLQVSNVPGSPLPLYLAGAKVTKLFPFGPVPGPAAMITVHSYVGTCYVGINLDPAAITEPELFRTCLQEGVDEVLALG